MVLLLQAISIFLVWQTSVSAQPVPVPFDRYNLETCVPGKNGTVQAMRGEKSLLGPLVTTGRKDYVCARGGTTSVEGSGQERFRMESQNNLIAFQRHFKKTGEFSVVLWLTVGTSSLDVERPILTLGDNMALPIDESKGCPGYNYRIAQKNRTFTLAFTDYQRVCQHLTIPFFWVGITGRVNLAIVFEKSRLQVYMAGVAQYSYERTLTNMTLDMRKWEENSASSLQLFSNFPDDDVFLGALRQVDFYDWAITEDDVNNLITRGVGYLANVTEAPTAAPIRWKPSRPQSPTATTTTSSPSTRPSLAPSASPFSLKTQVPTRTPTSTPNASSTPSVSPNEIVSLAPSVTPTVGPSASPSIRGVRSSVPSPSPSLEPTVVPPPTVKTTKSDTEDTPKRGGVAWQTVAFGVIGGSMALFCLFSVLGGYPRFLERASSIAPEPEPLTVVVSERLEL